VKVDLINLKLAQAQGKSEKIVIQANEAFIRSAMNIINRAIISIAALARIDLELEWDEVAGGFTASMHDLPKSSGGFDAKALYTPLESRTLYDINKVRVSPIKKVVSFRWHPQPL
jgi:hypothetical protein